MMPQDGQWVEFEVVLPDSLDTVVVFCKRPLDTYEFRTGTARIDPHRSGSIRISWEMWKKDAYQYKVNPSTRFIAHPHTSNLKTRLAYPPVKLISPRYSEHSYKARNNNDCRFIPHDRSFRSTHHHLLPR